MTIKWFKSAAEARHEDLGDEDDLCANVPDDEGEDETADDPAAEEHGEPCFNDLCACGHGLDEHGANSAADVACFVCACRDFEE